jgi:hypothetical protein
MPSSNIVATQKTNEMISSSIDSGEMPVDGSFLSILVFILITIYYYLGLCKGLKVEQLNDEKQMQSYTKTKYLNLVIYFLLIISAQYAINSGVLITKCGGDVGKNMVNALFLTFIPWVFIFGCVIAILLIFPGFKSAFSNVIGYFVVANSANKILTELLRNTATDNAIDSDETIKSEDEKKEYASAAEAILKLCGNTGILINQISPDNFNDYWKMLHPLMKPDYQSEGSADVLQQNLLDLVNMRDKIGESLWYIYTAVLIISIVSMNITLIGCTKDPETMKLEHDKYVANKASYDAEQEKLKSQTYTL